MSVLSEAQRYFYDENGYLLVSGLIPDEIAQGAERAMWEEMGASPDDPLTWTEEARKKQAYKRPEIVALFTDAYLAAAMELWGDSPEPFDRPKTGYAVNTFPSDGLWSPHAAHLDHSIKEHGHKTFPTAFRIASMCFLHDVEPHGGGTVVWPGAHQRVRALAESDPTRYELMWSLSRDLGLAEIGEPVEIIPRGGDVLFYQCLCPHSGSRNVSARPRLALNCKW